MNNKLIIAHRGASSEARENTIEAFQKAIAAGADMIELDVRKTKDNVLVVHHDPSIKGQKIKIKDLSYQRIRQLYPYIPTLEQVLKLTSGKIRLDIEIKEKGIADAAVDLALKYFKPEEFIISSFLSTVVKRIKKTKPGITTGLIIGAKTPREHLKFLKLVALRLAAKADVLVISRKLWKAELARFLPHHKQVIYIWTVDAEKEIEKLMCHNQISGIITNDPASAIKLRDRI